MNNQHNYTEVSPEILTYLQLQFDWSDPKIRMKIALEGIALNILVNDSNQKIRQLVAYQRYGLDQLVNDPDRRVRELAKHIQKDALYEKAKKITDDMFREAGCL